MHVNTQQSRRETRYAKMTRISNSAAYRATVERICSTSRVFWLRHLFSVRYISEQISLISQQLREPYDKSHSLGNRSVVVLISARAIHYCRSTNRNRNIERNIIRKCNREMRWDRCDTSLLSYLKLSTRDLIANFRY